MLGMKRASLSATALGIALGVVCGLSMFIVGLWAVYSTNGTFAKDMVMRWKEVLPGVDVTVLGAWVAGAWGLLKGFIFGIILGWIYNLCLCCCSRCCPCCKCGSCGGGKCSCNRPNCPMCNPNVPKV